MGRKKTVVYVGQRRKRWEAISDVIGQVVLGARNWVGSQYMK
jgi:hypothetical protein